MDKIIIYCDGACSGNQFAENIGGWGAVLKYKEKHREIFGGVKNTTNNIMEMSACIEALKTLTRFDIPVEVCVDSAYVCNGMNDWHKKWESNGWRTSTKKPVENKDLWIELLELSRKQRDIKFIKVKGHVGIILNELADELANKGMDEVRRDGAQ